MVVRLKSSMSSGQVNLEKGFRLKFNTQKIIECWKNV